jgi:hypothetical protein
VSKEPVGSVGEEAAKLFAVLQQAAADARGADHPSGPAAGDRQRRNHGVPADDVRADDVQADDLAADGVRADDLAADGLRADDGGAGEHEHGTARSGVPACQWCPICQLISRVRSTSPETIEQLATAAAGVLGSVRSLLEAAAESARQARADAEARAARQGDANRPTGPRVDRIDVSEDPEPWD